MPHSLPRLQDPTPTWILRRKNTTRRGRRPLTKPHPPGWEEAASMAATTWPWIMPTTRKSARQNRQQDKEGSSQIAHGCTPRGEQAGSHGRHLHDNLRNRNMPMDRGGGDQRIRPTPHRGAPNTSKLHTERILAERTRKGKPKGRHPIDPSRIWLDPSALATANKDESSRPSLPVSAGHHRGFARRYVPAAAGEGR
jgi:hypothetical protein